jgi:ferredoxin/flavodoxin---NADP+ reductase
MAVCSCPTGYGRPYDARVGEPRRVAIIGAGPSGIFAAQALLNHPGIQVDLYDRLPTPYGLLRYGVAPDHTSIKGMGVTLARVFDSPDVRFLGNVELGRDVTREELLGAYDAVIYAAGAAEDAEMAVPGENLPGSQSARSFVAWYSGHPDAVPFRLAGVRSVVTVGVGNVAVDVSRILCKTAAELTPTDMPDAVLNELRGHAVRDVWVVGRRGPEHASFTTTELRELLTLPEVQPVVHDDLDGLDVTTLDRRPRANVEALRAAKERHVPDASMRLHLLFWHRPVEIRGNRRVSGITLERTALDADGRLVGTGEERTVQCELVLRAIGYRATPLPGVAFDEARGVIPNRSGRVVDACGEVAPREYAVGWIKRGPTGVIGTNKSDAAETVAALVEDLEDRSTSSTESGDRVPLEPVDQLLRRKGLRPTWYADWMRIDAAETALGGRYGRARTKIATWAELLDIARGGEAASARRRGGGQRGAEHGG